MSTINRSFSLAGNATEFCWRNGLEPLQQFPLSQIQPAEGLIRTIPLDQPTTLSEIHKAGKPAPDRGTTQPWHFQNFGSQQ